MPVNTAALKTFAPAMRRQLLEAVGRKLDLLLNSQTPDTLSTYAKQIAELREQEEENREQLLERVAYTWFNRLCALRYLDARGWHPFGCKVLMPAAVGETQPELLKLMRAGNLPADLQSHTNQGRLHGLLDGQIQTAIAGADPQGEVYRQLVLAVCRCYHELLPNLFEGLDDASELLLPDDLLSDGSIVGAFRKEINDDDCLDVESLGWLYQFYIAEKKDEVMARKKAVPTEDIPAVTQLFTPHWIVRYLVENSLGRLWLLNRPGSKLRDQMPYYIEGDAETDFLVINKPEEIKLLDPACGSGHMLTYAFDLLVLIYEEEGYSPNEIPGLILKHNLHGLEICPRAAQLAELALVFKAREQSRRFFQPEQLVKPQIIELQNVQFAEGELNDFIEALDLGELFDPSLFKLLHQFAEAKNYGSLIQPCLDERAIANARRAIEVKDLGGQLFLRGTHLKVLRVFEQAEALTQRYHVVVANPPYMGRSGMTASLKAHVEHFYKNSKGDLCTAFIERSCGLILPKGFLSMVTLQGWMTLGSFAAFRQDILGKMQIETMIKIGFNSFPELNSKVALACAVIAANAAPSRSSKYFDLNTAGLSDNKEEVFLSQKESGSFYMRNQKQFLAIPGAPLAFDAPEPLYQAFREDLTIGSEAGPRVGMQTSDNSAHLRFWWEINVIDIHASVTSASPKWVRYIKGGGYRKWYGNDFYVLFYGGDGQRILKTQNATLMPMSRIKATKCTWTDIALAFNCRLAPGPAAHDISGHCMYPREEDMHLMLSYSNSSVFGRIIDALNGTLHYQVGDVAKVPFKYPSERDQVEAFARSAVEICRQEWDEHETSRDFSVSSFLAHQSKNQISSRTCELVAHSIDRRELLRSIEVQNNQAWIDCFDFGEAVDSCFDDKYLTLSRQVSKDLIREFSSYSVGCMMGRYSLDHPGLILANAGDTLEQYYAKVGKNSDAVAFQPDRDGIIPVLDGEWFEDDIVARTREFLAVTFPESSVAENLRFIEESLGKDIRKYFCSDFYKDHLQTYKKRPIYWLVQSPKKGFSCLIYLHRYTKDTLNQVLNNYFRPYLQKLEARLAQLGLDQLNDALPTRDRTAARKEADKITKVLKECQAWEQDALLPLAQQRIELDLDDGVKVNYLKLQDVLAPIPGLAAKED